jgi:cardiolipin synthase
MITPAIAAQDKETFLEKLSRYHDLVQSIVQGSLDSRGMSPETHFRPNGPTYNSIAVSIDTQLRRSACISTDCEDYFKDFSHTTWNGDIGHAEEMRLLPNVESFELRRGLIKNAKKSIHILVWAVYNDETGIEFRDLLLEAVTKKPDLDVRIVVDGNMANIYGKKLLKRLEKDSGGKIKIMKWKSRRYRASGTHRKMIIVDTEHVIVGGMNIGNYYSHHPAAKSNWRDLDLYIKGMKVAENAQNQFVMVWNKQLAEFPKLRQKFQEMPWAECQIDFKDGAPVIFVDQHPGSAVKDSYHNIHTSVVKLFRDAKDTIDIENAYFIMDPIIKKELEKAIKRGVDVRIFTNSDKSSDEPIVSMPIMHSARDAVTMGAKVYLRQTTTLHSKFMVVDKKITMIGSFNLHPRSLRFDAENVAVIYDEKLALQMTEHFNQGIESARFFDDPELFKINCDLISFLTQSFYFDFL